MIDNTDIASYADDNTPYSVGKSQCDLEPKLQKASVKLFKWFHDINTKFLLPACILENADSQKLLDVTIERKLNFNEHLTNLCDQTSKRI